MEIHLKSVHITTREVPGYVALALEIGGCRQNCKGCHSAELAETSLHPFSADSLISLVKEYLRVYPEVEVILLMGGTNNKGITLEELKGLIEGLYFETETPVALYSGSDTDYFDFFLNTEGLYFLKVGSYKEECGGLENKNTNQRFFKKVNYCSGHQQWKAQWDDYTYLFQPYE